MGWTGTWRYGKEGGTLTDWLINEMGLNRDGYKVLGHSVRIDRAWFIVETPRVASIALLVLIHQTRDGYITYKEVEESMGPNHVDIPRRLFAMLDDTDHGEFSREWRERVTAHHARLADRPTVKAGDRVTFGGPIEFANGDTFTTMVYEGNGRHFRAGSWNGRYRLPRDWRTTYRYTVERADGRSIMAPERSMA